MKDMRYTVGPGVVVRLVHKKNEPGFLADDRGFVQRFIRFCINNDLVNVMGGTTGPGIHTGCYVCGRNERDTDEVRFLIDEYLRKEGATKRREW